MNFQDLAIISIISDKKKHPNADLLEVVRVSGYDCVVKINDFVIGEKVVFIFPDSILPDADWADFYKKKSHRVKSIKIRGVWSQGICEKIDRLNITGEVGDDVTTELNIQKYEFPTPQDLSAKGNIPFMIPKTDEINFQRIDNLPFGELVDVTLKVDGQSGTYYHSKSYKDPVLGFIPCKFGATSRSLDIKLDCDNNYTKAERRYNILEKLNKYCKNYDVSLAVRGEVFGSNIQAFNINPHKGLPLDWAMFSVWLIDEKRYARKGEQYYFLNIAEEIGLPTVPVLEKDVVLTPELIKKYCEDMTELNGKPFEGVVIQHSGGSFKVINKYYDSKK